MILPSNTFIQYLQEKIENQDGYISFADFMELVLYHHEWGYYNSLHFDLGKQGDFITAPEISPLFAQCIALQCREIFEHSGQNQILELGAGTGRFAKDLLLYLETIGYTPTTYYIYEKSKQLREKQQRFLQSACPHLYSHMMWLDQLPEKISGIVIANEVLDALPVHCFHIKDQMMMERCVTWKKNTFAWTITKPTTHELMTKVTPIQLAFSLPDGYESEINLGLTAFLQSIISIIDQGVLLFIDYGYGQREYYHPKRTHGTLSCFYQHRYHTNPLILPGQQDITAHVDFTRVIEIATERDAQLLGYTTQAAFLLACGLLDFAIIAEKHLSPIEAIKLHQAIKCLTLPMEMGERVKVMAIGKKMSLAPLGFQSQDRRRDL
ncbi:MAG: hypothetical protein A3F42_08500 [Gammaproteobacteria bacterium RIFCSPHIGHO2_12_FULL_37_34]|nr:MAG: hypothetical protein A3F42_08500 [Gammaproteobacteria bacterium RIFCSPHIGHO2_12_FULL_37_34]